LHARNLFPNKQHKKNAREDSLVRAQRLPKGLFSFPAPYPPRQLVEHTYGQVIRVANDAVTSNKLGSATVVSLNDIFSPGGAGAHQPYGRDQMAALYGAYKVHAVIMRVAHQQSVVGTPNASTLIMGINSPSSGITYTGLDLQTAMEQPSVEWVQSSWGFMREFTKRFDIARIVGVSKEEFQADTSVYAALAGASPSKTCSVSFACGSETAGTTSSICLTVELTYVVEWFQRIIQPAS